MLDRCAVASCECELGHLKLGAVRVNHLIVGMCVNAFAKINKTNPNLSFFFFLSGAPGTAGQPLGYFFN